ncbi:MAG: hypothetical protein ACR2MP_35045 [Streptosporangiaceae bacterium]
MAGRAVHALLGADLDVACADVSRPGQRDSAEAAQGENESGNPAYRPGARDSGRRSTVSTAWRPTALHHDVP